MADEANITAEQAHPFLTNTDIKTVLACANCVLIKRQVDDALLQLKSLIELLQQDDEELKRANHEGRKEEKMADSVGYLGDKLNITKGRKEILENECQGCVRLKLEVNHVTLELESATEIIKILKEELESVVMEGRNTKSFIFNKDSKSDSCCDEGNQINIKKKLQ
jgi:phage terminase small subunit